MEHPTKAIILAAGFGARMLPLSLDIPKPMMPFWNKPILGHVLDMLAHWGVREALINLHHQPDLILQYARQKRRDNLRVCLSFEPDILGTGGALNKAGWFLDSKPFWMINADVVADLNPAPLLKAFASRQCLAALWLHPSLGPRTVEMTRGVITNFQSSRPGTDGTFTFCGLHLVAPEILQYIPERRFSSIIRAYDRAMRDGHRILGGCLPRSFWADMGTPESYLHAHRDALERYRQRLPGHNLVQADMLRHMTSFKRRGIRITGFAAIGSGVVIEKGAGLSDSVIWDNAHIAADAVIEKAIVGTRTWVHGRVPRIAVRSDFPMQPESRPADPQLAVALAKLQWDPAGTTVIHFEPRGSARVFTRLEHGRRSVIMIRYSLVREENALYVPHARFLKAIGWPVPTVLCDVPEQHIVIIEDLGDLSLQRLAASAMRPQVEKYYRAVVRSVHGLHELGTQVARRKRLKLVAPFSNDLYRWEREFFARQFLHPRLRLPPADIAAILLELEHVAQHLLQVPPALVHRDFQSSNIVFAGGKPFFIDFQGMRFGAAAYDVASLLCDPYVELPLACQTRLLTYYNETVTAGKPIPERLFWQAAVERLAQALGAYGRLCAQPDTAWFGKYIPPALRMMRRALQHAGDCERLLDIVEKAIDKPSDAEDNSLHSKYN